MPRKQKQASSIDITDKTNKYIHAASYAYFYIETNAIEVSETGSIKFGSRWSNPSIVYDKLITDYACDYSVLRHQLGKRNPYTKFTTSELMGGFKQAVEDKRQEAIDAVVDNLTAPPADPEAATKWVHATIIDPTPADVAVFKHWIWQVKRKLVQKPVKFHMMLNIRGDQGKGKTLSTNKLLSPLRELKAQRNIKELCDERNSYILGRLAVILIEELAGASAAEIEGFKAMITGEQIQSRILGTNSHQDNPQNVTLISTANTSVGEVISDATGMRRFYEVEFRRDEQKCWDEMNAIDVVDVWRSVDHNQDEAYILPFAAEIRAKQNLMVRESSLELFLANNPIKFVDEPAGMRQIDFLSDVKEFIESLQRTSYSTHQKIHQELRRLTNNQLKVFKKDRVNHYNFIYDTKSTIVNKPPLA